MVEQAQSKDTGWSSAFLHSLSQGLPGGSHGEESVCNAQDPCLLPGSGRSPGVGNGSTLQYSCPENSMDKGAWQSKVHGVTKSQTRPSG